MVNHKNSSLLYQLIEATPGTVRDGDVVPSDHTLERADPSLKAALAQQQRQIDELRGALAVDKLTEVGSPRALATLLAQTVLQAHKEAQFRNFSKTTTTKPPHITPTSTDGTAPEPTAKAFKPRAPISPGLATVVFLDSNDFKLINSHFGDPGGDAAIRLIGQFLKKNLRPEDGIGINRDPEGKKKGVYRKGGDEFVAVMHCSKAEAEKRMRKLKGKFSREVSRDFLAEMDKMYPEGQVGKNKTVREKEYSEALAEKHRNDKLKDKPFQLSFSFGAIEVEPEKFANREFNSLEEVYAAATDIIRDTDAAMKDDKAAHVADMRKYSADVTTHTGRAPAPTSSHTSGKKRGTPSRGQPVAPRHR